MDSNANRKHKDSVFSKLFSNPEILRELYSAIENVEISKDAIIDINTLSEALFMRQINDLSFTINDQIVVLIEHQSTIGENVPLRLLMYIGRVYEKIIENKNIYHRKLLKIPSPKFIVLYNGKENYPDYQELKLSSAFKDTSNLKLPANNNLPLELIVQIYNINHGKNPEMLKRSVYLNDYSLFIKKINEFKDQHFSLDESVRAAVNYCIEHNVLREFLEEHGTEVSNMLFDDITIEEIAEIRFNEGCENKALEIARNLLAKSSTPEFVSEITGLSLEEIAKL